MYLNTSAVFLTSVVMNMNINNLPKDCIFLILGHVCIAVFPDAGKSTLATLAACKSCYQDGVQCSHLHEKEAFGIKTLKLVCKKWCHVIQKEFPFTAGPDNNTLVHFYFLPVENEETIAC